MAGPLESTNRDGARQANGLVVSDMVIPPDGRLKRALTRAHAGSTPRLDDVAGPVRLGVVVRQAPA